MRRSAGGFLGLVLAVAAALTPIAADVTFAPPALAAGQPADTPARTGVPGNIAVIGDSISTATGTGNLGAEMDENSWVTGTNGTVNSMRDRLGIPAANAYTLAANGERMTDFVAQANSAPLNTQYVVVELGGNDLCRPSVGEMTSVATYRAQFRAGLQALAARVPDALVFVASVPDIYNLWYLRGAPSSVNPNVAADTDQEGQARLYWDNGLVDVIPCKSLLENPTSTSAGDEARRQQVRTRNLAFNDVLAEECGAVLRCRFDAHSFFNLSSNRANPPDGPLAPYASWWFRDIDISHNSGFWKFLCPAPGVLDGGTICGDHFHPSLSGQAKLAFAGHTASYQFTDTTAPTRSITPARAPDGNGVYRTGVELVFGGADTNGIRGQEVRVQGPTDSAPGPWQQHLGLAPPLTVSATGTTYVQVRTLDLNGNLSASLTQAITVDPSQFGDVTGTVSGPSGPLSGIEVSLHAAGAEGALATDVTGADGDYAFPGLLAAGDVKVLAHDPTGDHVDEWFDSAATHGAATAIDVPGGGSTIRDLVLDLTPGSLEGTVTDGTTPLAGITVELHPDAGPGALASTTTDGDGAYVFTDLAPGSYKVAFIDGTGVHVGEWNGDALSHGAADPVPVVKEEATTVDAVLGRVPGGLSGTVSGPDGPLEDVIVSLSPGDQIDVTDASGNYSFSGLAPGVYTVSVLPVACAWLGDDAEGTVPTGGATGDADLTLSVEPPGPHGFSDVPTELDDAVAWATNTCNDPRFMEGYRDATFRPTLPITRAAVVRALWRMEGSPEASTPNTFTDTPAWTDPSVSWVVEEGYMTGYAGNVFRPLDRINRAEVARLFFRLSRAEPPMTSHGFTDVPPWVQDAVSWLVAEEHLDDAVGGTFRPRDPGTRAEFVDIAFRVNS